MRHRVAQVRQVVHSEVYLRRYHNRRLGCELGMVVTHHHHRRHDLLHSQLRQLAFWGLQLVAIAATAAATNLSLRWRHGRNVFRRCNQSDSLVRLLNLFHHTAPKERQANQPCQSDGMHSDRVHRAVFLVIVEAPDVPDRDRLRGQNQWRLFLGKKYSSKLWNRDFHNGCSSEDLSSSRCNSGSRSTGGVTSTVAISEMSLSQSFFGGNNRFPRHPHI